MNSESGLHLETLKREEERWRARAEAAGGGGPNTHSALNAAAAAAAASSVADLASLTPSAEPVRLTLQNKQNAKEYRKKISVHAFRTTRRWSSTNLGACRSVPREIGSSLPRRVTPTRWGTISSQRRTN